jgi:hypothetical protein
LAYRTLHISPCFYYPVVNTRGINGKGLSSQYFAVDTQTLPTGDTIITIQVRQHHLKAPGLGAILRVLAHPWTLLNRTIYNSFYFNMCTSVSHISGAFLTLDETNTWFVHDSKFSSQDHGQIYSVLPLQVIL